jgi:hypothetical protein
MFCIDRWGNFEGSDSRLGKVPLIAIALSPGVAGRITNLCLQHMLAQAYLEHDVNLISLRTNKLLDTLRSERRFQDLVRRVGLQS